MPTSVIGQTPEPRGQTEECISGSASPATSAHQGYQSSGISSTAELNGFSQEPLMDHVSLYAFKPFCWTLSFPLIHFT